ncbi:MAG: hypothetical protein AAF465_04250 [Pseudomonadota bacterium]
MKAFVSVAAGVVLFALSLIQTGSWAQVDPAWLASWNAAQASRPLTVLPQARIASDEEPGVPLVISGQVFTPDGRPASGVVVHAYHRDSQGLEFDPQVDLPAAWRLHGWAKTNAEGRFEFATIRPAPDTQGREGAHVHFTLASVAHGRQWASKLFFSDDPLVSPRERDRSRQAGEFGWVRDVQTIDGVQLVTIHLKLKERADF